MSLFAQPAPRRRRRRGRKHAASIACCVPVAVARDRIDKAISSVWRECFLDGCSIAAWQHAAFADQCLRYRRHFIGGAIA